GRSSVPRTASRLLAVVLRRDPTAHVLGAVDDLDSCQFSAREKAYRGPIDEGNVPQIENGAAGRRACEQLLQPFRMLGVQHSAQDEDARAGLPGLVDSVGHVRAPWLMGAVPSGETSKPYRAMASEVIRVLSALVASASGEHVFRLHRRSLVSP